MNRALLLVPLLLAGLVGCSTKREVVVKTEYVYIGIPDNLTQTVVPTTPPDSETYVKASLEERTTLLTVYALDLLKDTKNLNARLASIDGLDEKNRKTVEEFNRREKARVAKLVGEKVKELKDER